ncbi:hypothetical protein MRX96_026844 [Rhipicephalus microplus]
MSPATFDVLHSLVKEKLTKDQCPSREAISSGEHLALTLRHQQKKSGGKSLLGVATVGSSQIALEPSTANIFKLNAPRNGWSLYFNYKGTHSIVLIAVVDSQYLFRLVNVGAPGRFSDGGISQDSPIGERLHEGELSLPQAVMLPRSGRVCLHVFGGDEAFQLGPDFMRPLPGSRSVPAEVIYNYRLSRARRCVKNAFGILVSCWRIYERQRSLEPENVEAVVKATCVLHNFLSSNAASTYCLPGYADFQDTFGNVSGGAWRQGPGSTTVFGLEKPKARNCSKVASAVQQEFVKYFNEEGQVPWQWKLPGVAPHQP